MGCVAGCEESVIAYIISCDALESLVDGHCALVGSTRQHVDSEGDVGSGARRQMLNRWLWVVLCYE